MGKRVLLRNLKMGNPSASFDPGCGADISVAARTSAAVGWCGTGLGGVGLGFRALVYKGYYKG